MMNCKKILFICLAVTFFALRFLPTKSVQAESFRPLNQFNDYYSVATVDGQWGANLYQGNDQDRVFDRILPRESQWKIYGYTKRSDGYYYWAGANNWIEADQVQVPAQDEQDAILNIVTKYPKYDSSSTYNTYRPIWNPSGGYWGDQPYWTVVRYEWNELGAVAALQWFVVYADGAAYPVPYI
ncbi:hypothetical protein ACNAN0_01125 [Agrilactobacillus fermenti]|uniref:hypothetical protein n=1 Tax=Agrilactobacillus fermenti TaxID=2586909 RepID=UPI003A5BA7F7